MAIAHEETAGNSGSIGAAANLTVTVAGAPSDDECLFALCHKDDSAGGQVQSTLPSGFTKLTAISVATTDDRDRVVDVGYKIASSEGTTYDFNNAGANTEEMQALISVWSGVDTTTPIDLTITASHYSWFPNIPPDPDSPSITTVTDNAVVLALMTLSGATASRTIGTTPPTGYTVRFGTSDPIANAFIGMASKLVATAGAENPAAFTVTNGAATDDGYAATIALRPAAAGGSIAPIAVNLMKQLQSN